MLQPAGSFPTSQRQSVTLLQISKNQTLTAVPLFELHDNAAKFGPVIAGLPVMLSRLRLTLSGTGRPLAAGAAGAAAGGDAAGGADANGWGDDELAMEIYGQ